MEHAGLHLSELATGIHALHSLVICANGSSKKATNELKAKNGELNKVILERNSFKSEVIVEHSKNSELARANEHLPVEVDDLIPSYWRLITHANLERERRMRRSRG